MLFWFSYSHQIISFLYSGYFQRLRSALLLLSSFLQKTDSFYCGSNHLYAYDTQPFLPNGSSIFPFSTPVLMPISLYTPSSLHVWSLRSQESSFRWKRTSIFALCFSNTQGDPLWITVEIGLKKKKKEYGKKKKRSILW